MMSGFPTSNQSDYDENGYINFNQFLLQHNLDRPVSQNNFGQTVDPISTAPLNPAISNDLYNYTNIDPLDFGAYNYANFNEFSNTNQAIGQLYNDENNIGLNLDPFQQNNYQAYSEPTLVSSVTYSNDLVASSTLLPTAEEFIPRFNNITLNNTTNEPPDGLFSQQMNGIVSKNNPFLFTNDTFNGNSATINNQENNLQDDGLLRNGNSLSSLNTGAIRKSNSHTQARSRNSDQRHHSDGQYQVYGNYYRSNGYYNHKNKSQFDNNRNSRRKDARKENKDYDYRNIQDVLDDDDFSESPHSINDNSSNKAASPKNGGRDLNDQFSLKVFDPTVEPVTQREKLIQEIEERKLECLVCVDSIKTHHSIWSCSSCFHIFHLSCITKWANSSTSETGWRCPACQNTLKQVPRDYYCFCGKTRNPQYNRNDVAHSCGEVCGRKTSCDHPCTLLCHPGPCPHCQATLTRECGCGKSSRIVQCYLKEEFSCGEVCDLFRNCRLHKCDSVCHDGKCADCELIVDHKCHCGKVDRQVPCTKESNEKKSFSCGKTCNRPLSCCKHKCKDSCHSGDCRPCKLSPEVVTSCPCGKMPIPSGKRTTCADPVPLCQGICSKTLKCGQPASPHQCISKCHVGQCAPCNKQTAVKCRCGHMDQMIKCKQLSTRADDARCKKRCTKKRNCGKHKCNQECCIDIDHICPLPCNYNLTCGKHKCDQPCHRGNCAPCYRSSFEELYCECGANVIYPPVPCGTKRPACDKPCTRQHSCDHPVKHNCHSAPTCPPCIMFTTKYCFGGHEMRKTIPCNQESFSCGMPCNKDLNCKRHKCIKPCHSGPCQIEGDVCKQSCVAARSACGHKCNASCHDGDCPDIPCKEVFDISCDCGNRKQTRTCHDFSSEYRRIATAKLASSMQEMQRGNCIELTDILGPIKLSNNKTLECNEDCKLLWRNRQVSIGLQIRNPDLSSKLQTRYSDFIRGWAKKDPQLVRMIHDKLTELVKLSKESKQRSRSHSFPTMNREKRQLVHEMCGMFGVESVAYDAEPNRNVVATACRDKSWLPAVGIMEVMARESGQRRVPVPTNNAWKMKK